MSLRHPVGTKAGPLATQGAQVSALALAAALLLAAPLAAQRTRTQQQRGSTRTTERTESRSTTRDTGVRAQDPDDDKWLADCRDRERSRDDDRRYVYCDVKVDRVDARSAIHIDGGQNGGVQVRGDDRNDIEVHARIQTWAALASDARGIADDIRLDYGRGDIKADGPEPGRRESWSVTFVVLVPDRSDLDLVAHNGPVSVESVRGRIDAKTQNGPLALRSVGGEVTARTQNGPLTVDLSGTRWDGEGLDAETGNGPVRLTIPDGYSAKLQTGTVNGPFTTDVPLTITHMGRIDRRVDTTLGNGGATVRAVTTNGPVVIQRAERTSRR